jgi:peptidoglycan/LPS O-acetylase OafA/YrhL
VKRIPSLDGLRAISILLVVFGHLAKTEHAPRIFWDHYANTGVRIFFVISGFLITTILSKEHRATGTISLRSFYIRRAYRIFPAAFLFMTTISILYWREVRWYNVGSAFLYVANFDASRPWIFGHLWSLSVEEQFYFVWPTILKKWHRHRVAILLTAIALVPVGQILLYLAGASGGNIGGFPGVAGSLAVGCLLASTSFNLPKLRAWHVIILFLVVLMVPLFDANSRGRTLLLVCLLEPLLNLSIGGLLIAAVRFPPRFLNFAPMCWLGRISYSLYLWQQPFCSDPHLRSGYLVFFALLAACFSYYFVEAPMLRRRDSAVRSKTDRSVLMSDQVPAAI